MRYLFVVIENRPAKLALTLKLLRDEYPGCSLWPESEQNTVKSWLDAWKRVFELKTDGWHSDKDARCVLIVDLALDRSDRDFGVGISELKECQPALGADFVLVVSTIYADAARRELSGVADAVLSSRRIVAGRDRDRSKVLRAVIDQAVAVWEKKSGKESSVQGRRVILADSPAARRVDAALGREAIDELGQKVGFGWDQMRAAVLSGGYSGAYLLRLTGTEQGTERQVVCKVTREKDSLTKELEAWKKAVEAYGRFAGLIPPYRDTEPAEVVDDIWYIVMAAVPGPTLELALVSLQADKGGNAIARALKGEFEKCLNQLEIVVCTIPPGAPKENASASLRLSKDDVDRMSDAARTLCTVRDECVRRNCLKNEEWHSPARIRKFVHMVNHWPESCANASLPNAPVYEQHGDMNPRNIILPSKEQVQLIDFARFGPWPVGYDLVRLELQLLLRLLDRRHLGDSFPNGLSEWWSFWLQLNRPDAKPARKSFTCDPGGICLWMVERLRKAYRKIEKQVQPGTSRDELAKLTQAMRCYEAIKMCSYEDASTFKRLWFLMIGIDAAQKAGLMVVGR